MIYRKGGSYFCQYEIQQRPESICARLRGLHIQHKHQQQKQKTGHHQDYQDIITIILIIKIIIFVVILFRIIEPSRKRGVKVLSFVSSFYQLPKVLIDCLISQIDLTCEFYCGVLWFYRSDMGAGC